MHDDNATEGILKLFMTICMNNKYRDITVYRVECKRADAPAIVRNFHARNTGLENEVFAHFHHDSEFVPFIPLTK